ncbi:NAD-dependent epimerase/dehydratase family protein [Streptomyces roseirectus]|uniref:NAD-dependent epimerase/dehydratase family protein n=1 Tax=Streptomyces roseirectus TaxID=2768066 RepID=A0A7H0IJX0_9ACTN|nr:NAD-dependent epimerase/dehydratase family protein [Streptomyces roseirectus]QNP73086.1 NAD-dependent epimerase/dehydratase family protein [Streptomyces roseirectus]
MRLLVLGGTQFVGRAVVEAALARGWEVTVFNRGSVGALPGARAVVGDRTAEGGMSALGEGSWDAVVDTWAREPRAVQSAARLLRGRAGRYAYVSSLSVYEWAPPAGYDEGAKVVDGASPGAGRTEYAQDKRGGELAVLESFGEERSLFARAGLILGPYENVGRLPWWLTRVARGGPVLAPGPRELPVQYIDARDLAEWTLGALEREVSGPVNLVSPQGHTTMGELLDACVNTTASTADLRWTAPETVLAAGVKPWTELPVWVPPGSDMHDALHSADVSRALATGLSCRPVTETVADTWTWLKQLDEAPQRPDLPIGLDPEAEARVLAG